MIRVTVQLIPKGIESAARTLGTMEIADRLQVIKGDCLKSLRDMAPGSVNDQAHAPATKNL